jgi:hypothetical protein
MRLGGGLIMSERVSEWGLSMMDGFGVLVIEGID